jgi:hypothetical protein
MLIGELIAGIEVSGTQLQSQTGATGWHIDDLLVTASGSAHTKRLAISCKSNVQVSGNGLPADFVARAWKQWRDAGSPLDPMNDSMALVTRERHPTFDPIWTDIKNWCSGDSAQAIARIRCSRKHARILESVRSPEKGAIVATDEEAIALIKHLEVLPVDFQLASSNDVALAISRCRELLVSGEPEEAHALWRELVNIAAGVRLGSGTLPLFELWSMLRRQYVLKDHPDFRSSWVTLRNLTADYTSRIQTTLSAGFALDRSKPSSELEEALPSNLVTVVYGDSGTGKSALVKGTLALRFPNWTQVWLGPDELKLSLSEARRSSLPLAHPLLAVLNASASASNVLVIDAAERIEPAELVAVKQFVQALLAQGATVAISSWRLIIVTQTQSWAETSQALLDWQAPALVEVENLSPAEVKAALRSSNKLSWLVPYNETIAALTNLRTLAWFIQAGDSMGSEAAALSSYTGVADQLWRYWTNGKPDIQGLVIRLAEREASFERSFAISKLDPADASIFSGRPSQLPLRTTSRNHIEFEHDLAADWARFQRLKEIADDTAEWAAFASNPLWTGALRMLGQFLLREVDGTATGWDRAYGEIEEKGPPLAADALLDALCLDPAAERFLTERAEFLLSNNGARLIRLLLRFHHIATVPAGIPFLLEASQSLSVYVEATFRGVVYGRWPPIARFLYHHLDRVAELKSAAVAKICETWLTRTPDALPGGLAMPFRKEFAELALATARAVQVHKGQGAIYTDAEEGALFTAALAGARDLPEEIAMWALEMAGRRSQSAAVTRRIAEARQKQAEEYAQRMRADPTFREAQEERTKRARQMPKSIVRSRRLSPWPLGPAHRIDSHFRRSCLNGSALACLMQVSPNVAAELLLALMIEDEPREEYRSSISDELGLEYDHDAYPTAYWKSPFLQFLPIAPDIALGALIKLVDFCTERWAAEIKKRENLEPWSVQICLKNGAKRKFLGGPGVFDWTQESALDNGQLHCALDALEFWLTRRIDASAEVASYIEQILNEGGSVAFLGVLVNVGKYCPSLFAGPLAPLVTNQFLYTWDDGRVDNVRYHFDGMSWARQGEAIFQMAKSWTLAAHRQKTLLKVTSELLLADAGVASALKSATSSWEAPDDTKGQIEFHMLCAVLDRDNYQVFRDPESGETVQRLVYPPTLVEEALRHNESVSADLHDLLLPSRCEEFIQRRQIIGLEEARRLYNSLAAKEGNGKFGDDTRSDNSLAVAATLIVCAGEWLASNQEAKDYVHALVKTAVMSISDAAQDASHARIAGLDESLKFAAYGVMELWVREDEADTSEWEALVLRLLTCGNDRVVAVAVSTAHANRARLGDAWWRLLQVGLFWSALWMLAPHYGDPPNAGPIWNRWIARLRAFKLRGVSADYAALDITRVARAYGRLQWDRWVRTNNLEDKRWRQPLDERRSPGLEWHFLQLLFGWLLDDRPTTASSNADHEPELVAALWAYEVQRFQEHSRENDEYDLPSRLGYALLDRLTQLSLTLSPAEARSLWQSVLTLGPWGHYAVSHFLLCFFMPSRMSDRSRFCLLWREMAEFGLAASWDQSDLWFHGENLLCSLLGFGHESALTSLPDASGAIEAMRGLYKRWAEEHLANDEKNIEQLSRFLSSPIGAPIRLDGLQWITAALQTNTRAGRWYRSGTGEALISLVDTATTANIRELAKSSAAREALLALTADLAARNISAVFVLQERIKQLR